MVLKADIDKAYKAQQQQLKVDAKNIGRFYLEDYKPDKKHIEVITGIRRCGKSTLMKHVQGHMLKPLSELFKLNYKDLQVQFLNQRIEEEFGDEPFFIEAINNIKQKNKVG